jgi:hypothetical protein
VEDEGQVLPDGTLLVYVSIDVENKL